MGHILKRKFCFLRENVLLLYSLTRKLTHTRNTDLSVSLQWGMNWWFREFYKCILRTSSTAVHTANSYALNENSLSFELTMLYRYANGWTAAHHELLFVAKQIKLLLARRRDSKKLLCTRADPFVSPFHDWWFRAWLIKGARYWKTLARIHLIGIEKEYLSNNYQVELVSVKKDDTRNCVAGPWK